MNKVYLVGMPASGKSTTARWLSRKLGWDWLDLDDVLEKNLGMTVSMAFELLGEDKFREEEHTALLKTKNLSRVVVSCGGGTAVHLDNMDWMKNNGLTLYLNPEIAILADRIAAQPLQRPYFKGLSGDDILNKLLEMQENRANFYSEAKIIWNKPEPTDFLYVAVNQLIDKE
jgi:shikimate kinase